MDPLPRGPPRRKPVLLPCDKNPIFKKNATGLLCCLSMWKCNVRKGLNLQRTIERGKMTVTALAKPPRVPTLWATCARGSVKYWREQTRDRSEARHWKKEKRDERTEGKRWTEGAGAERIGGQKGGDKEKLIGKVTDREMTRRRVCYLRASSSFPSAKWCDTGRSPVSARRRPQTARTHPINHTFDTSAFFNFFILVLGVKLLNTLTQFRHPGSRGTHCCKKYTVTS